jgi:hypothetical protein
MPYAICTVHKEMRSTCFLVEHQNLVRRLRYSDLCLKIIVMISWYGPENHAGYDLSVAPQNRRDEVGAGHASRSSGLLHLEASRVRVSQSDLKTGGCVITCGARDIIVQVALR